MTLTDSLHNIISKDNNFTRNQNTRNSFFSLFLSTLDIECAFPMGGHICILFTHALTARYLTCDAHTKIDYAHTNCAKKKRYKTTYTHTQKKTTKRTRKPKRFTAE